MRDVRDGREPPREEIQALRALLAATEDPARARGLPLDEAVLSAVAHRHRLTPLLSTLAAGALPPGLAEAFRRDRLVTTAHGLYLGSAATEAARALTADGIDVIVLKGLAYERALYGSAGLRPTSDVDLLVPSDKRRAAFAVLGRLGYRPRAAAPGFDEPDYHEVAWDRGRVEVDLHLGLAPAARCAIDYPAVWAARVPFDLGGAPAARLADDHAAVFHALHMAIDHFDVPGLYLVDLARLLPGPAEVAAATATARAWRAARPLETALALSAAFLPRWAAAAAPVGAALPPRAARVVAGFGGTGRLERPTQLRRKIEHIDTLADAVRYLGVQARRNLRELWETHVRRRTPGERLGVGQPPRRTKSSPRRPP
jgi:hypothetical protein